MWVSQQAYDSRGVAHASLAEYTEAAADFQQFLYLLQEADPTQYNQFAESRLRWIEALSAGIDPFTPEVIEQLLRE
ncbi:MAG: hypothetical protein ACK2TX_02175 [Anaerolineales bacterium]